jgi:cell division protease FtsH
MSQEKMIAQLAFAFGGREAELYKFGPDKVTSGASGDIQQATSLARRMVMEWGMSERLGRVRYASNQQEIFLGHSVAQSTNMSDETAKLIDEEVRKLIEDGERSARQIINENAEQFEAIAEALLEFETLTGDELRALMEGKRPSREDPDEPKTPRGSAVPSAGKPRPPAADGGMEPQPQG